MQKGLFLPDNAEKMFWKHYEYWKQYYNIHMSDIFFVLYHLSMHLGSFMRYE